MREPGFNKSLGKEEESNEKAAKKICLPSKYG